MHRSVTSYADQHALLICEDFEVPCNLQQYTCKLEPDCIKFIVDDVPVFFPFHDTLPSSSSVIVQALYHIVRHLISTNCEFIRYRNGRLYNDRIIRHTTPDVTKAVTTGTDDSNKQLDTVLTPSTSSIANDILLPLPPITNTSACSPTSDNDTVKSNNSGGSIVNTVATVPISPISLPASPSTSTAHINKPQLQQTIEAVHTIESETPYCTRCVDEKVKAIRTENKQLRNSNVTLLAEQNDYLKENKNLINERDTLKKQLTELGGRVAERGRGLPTSIQPQLTGREMLLQSNKYRCDVDVMINDGNAALGNLQQQLNELQQQCDTQTAELHTLRLENTELQDTITAKDTDIMLLNNKCKQMQSQCELDVLQAQAETSMRTEELETESKKLKHANQTIAQHKAGGGRVKQLLGRFKSLAISMIPVITKQKEIIDTEKVLFDKDIITVNDVINKLHTEHVTTAAKLVNMTVQLNQKKQGEIHQQGEMIEKGEYDKLSAELHRWQSHAACLRDNLNNSKSIDHIRESVYLALEACILGS